MNTESKLTLAGAGSILLLDSITSLLSARFHFSFVLCCLVTLAVYFGVTYWAAKHLNLRGTLAFGAFLGWWTPLSVGSFVPGWARTRTAVCKR